MQGSHSYRRWKNNDNRLRRALAKQLSYIQVARPLVRSFICTVIANYIRESSILVNIRARNVSFFSRHSITLPFFMASGKGRENRRISETTRLDRRLKVFTDHLSTLKISG